MFSPRTFLLSLVCVVFASTAFADENLLGYVKGAEPLPKGAWEIYEVLTSRSGKGAGKYQAFDARTEVEYGLTDRLSLSGEVMLQSIDVNGLLIDAYVPRDISYGPRPSGVEVTAKYNFLSPAMDDFGFATAYSVEYLWLDPHSGQGKDTFSTTVHFLLQKYFLEGQLVWLGNVGVESTYAHRDELSDLPVDFEWPTIPEMELEYSVGTGLVYRFIANWYLGAETLFETEYETEVGQERWSVFAGPSLHYGSQHWWATLTWFPQIAGGGDTFEGQDATHLHLIEKTKQEVRLKVGLNF